MASIMMTVSFLAAPTKQRPTVRRGIVAVRASKDSEKMQVVSAEGETSSNNTRRDLMFAVATAMACSVAKVAMADEPKRGSLDAKKKYAPVCVTMPTARICRY